jgi:hypothetical protein
MTATIITGSMRRNSTPGLYKGCQAVALVGEAGATMIGIPAGAVLAIFLTSTVAKPAVTSKAVSVSETFESVCRMEETHGHHNELGIRNRPSNTFRAVI